MTCFWESSAAIRTDFLRGGEFHIWLTYPESIVDTELLSLYHGLMSEEERERHNRFIFAKHRHAFLVTRALTRTTLSRYLQGEPADWKFCANAYGRPELDMPGISTPLRFNISHTEGILACLVGLTHDAGLDIEQTLRVKDPVQVADHFFSPAEVRALHALPTDKQRERFFRYWTLKEAYIKARGMGLAIPLAQFSFDVEHADHIGISFDARLEDVESRWRWMQWRVTAQHLMALGVSCEEDIPPFRIKMWEIVPMKGEPVPVSFERLGVGGRWQD